MKIYLSLPITGYKFDERIAYAAEQTYRLRNMFDCEVFNPLADYDENNVQTYEYYMGKDLWELSKCDTIVFCPGWGSSKGCMIEYWFAVNKNISMLEMNDEGWVRWNPKIHEVPL